MNDTANAYRTWVRRVVANYYGSPVVKTWRTWSGSPGDDDEIASGNLPAVRLTPLLGQSGRYDTDGITTTSDLVLRVQIEVAVNGTNWDEIARLSDNLLRAMFPQDDAERIALDAALREVGVNDVQLTSPPIPRAIGELGGGIMRATGDVSLVLNLET